jgi:hypothetical protein
LRHRPTSPKAAHVGGDVAANQSFASGPHGARDDRLPLRRNTMYSSGSPCCRATRGLEVTAVASFWTRA